MSDSQTPKYGSYIGARNSAFSEDRFAELYPDAATPRRLTRQEEAEKMAFAYRAMAPLSHHLPGADLEQPKDEKMAWAHFNMAPLSHQPPNGLPRQCDVPSGGSVTRPMPLVPAHQDPGPSEIPWTREEVVEAVRRSEAAWKAEQAAKAVGKAQRLAAE